MIPQPILLFDFDGTLYDTSLDIAHNLNRTRLFYGLPKLDTDLVLSHVGNGVINLITQCFPENPAAVPEIAARFEEIYLHNPVEYTEEYPGLSRFLADNRHIKLVVSNKTESIIKKIMEIKGTAKYFKAIIGGDTFPIKKPDARLLEHIKTIQPGDSSDFIMIGDDQPDINFAANANLRFIYCSHGFKADQWAEGKQSVTHFHHFNDAVQTAWQQPT